MEYSGVPPPGETRFAVNEVVVQFANTVPRREIEGMARQFGVAIAATYGFEAAGRTLYRFRSSARRDVGDLIRQLERNRMVAAAQPNYRYQVAQLPLPSAPQLPPLPAGTALPPLPGMQPPPSGPPLPPLPHAGVPPPVTPRAPAPASLPALPAGDPTQYALEKLHLRAAHRLSRGRDVSIAVIDSEIDTNHPDLQGAIAETVDPTGQPSRPHAHGTGMAGAIVARSRLLGVAPRAAIVAVRVFDDRSAGAEATSFQILKGLDYAARRGVRIINMSFAGPYDVMLERKLREAYDSGIVLVAAAGNAGPTSPPLYPAADPSVIAVTATDYLDRPFAMANRGSHIAVAAPGVDVLVPAPGGAYQLTTGTSVAAAHVSGTVALMLEHRPELTPEDVRAVLVGSAPALPANDNAPGVGLIDPLKALTYEPLEGANTATAVQPRGATSP